MMVKICGITNREDALAAVEGGASALGFIFYRKSPRWVEPGAVREILKCVPPGVWKVGVFVDEPPDRVAEIAKETGLDIVQLHGREEAAQFPAGLRAWKALRIADRLPRLDAYPAEALLLDGPAPGRSFDWSLAANTGKRIIIAGGLDEKNVGQAIAQSRPWGVDASSRLERAPGRKDHGRMARFLLAAREAALEFELKTTTC
ncbi:MAG: phosphoribosylanthranilate isomerase [Bryobacterales bacterium]|nr:phosphoribosylanthranilate isomerase [Bryobacterales bacterium]